METIVLVLLSVFVAAWEVLVESSLFILLGFFVAGLLKGFIPDNFIQRHLGGKSKSGVLKSSIFGVPIPLCSCGVIPAAAGLREQGASKGAVTSFMISTPETGVDSIAVTYALLDPVMTIIRPLAAFFIALVSGILVNIFDRAVEKDTLPEQTISHPQVASFHTIDMAEPGPCLEGCGCESTINTKGREDVIFGVKAKFQKGMSFAFGGLLDDIGPWLMVGIILAGTITVAISPDFIASYLGDGIFSMLIMIAIATPLYVCATASTPIAAALAIKGLSPGAALVFLLAGPATNMATITVVSKLLGKKTAVIYVCSIMFCSMVLGFLVNWLYLKMGLSVVSWVSSEEVTEHGFVYVASTIILLLLIVKPYCRRLYYYFSHSSEGAEHHDHNCGCGS